MRAHLATNSRTIRVLLEVWFVADPQPRGELYVLFLASGRGDHPGDPDAGLVERPREDVEQRSAARKFLSGKSQGTVLPREVDCPGSRSL